MSAQLLGAGRKAGSVARVCGRGGVANVASIKTMPPPHKIANHKSRIEFIDSAQMVGIVNK